MKRVHPFAISLAAAAWRPPPRLRHRLLSHSNARDVIAAIPELELTKPEHRGGGQASSTPGMPSPRRTSAWPS